MSEEEVCILDSEIESLKAIFTSDELEVKRVDDDDSGVVESLVIHMSPETSKDDSPNFVRFEMVFDIPKEYPEVIPKMHLRNVRGLSEETLCRTNENMKKRAEELIGNAMLFELIQVAKEQLTSEDAPSIPCSICLFGFAPEDVFSRTPCYHYFHSYCLARHVQQSLELNLAQEQKDPTKDTTQEESEQVVCPVCRLSIPFQETNPEGFPVPKESEVADAEFVVTPELRKMQDEMAALYSEQKAKGSIIDLEAEKNKFLIEISNTPDIVMLPSSPAASSPERRTSSGRVSSGGSSSKQRTENESEQIRKFMDNDLKKYATNGKSKVIDKLDTSVVDPWTSETKTEALLIKSNPLKTKTQAQETKMEESEAKTPSLDTDIEEPKTETPKLKTEEYDTKTQASETENKESEIITEVLENKSGLSENKAEALETTDVSETERDLESKTIVPDTETEPSESQTKSQTEMESTDSKLEGTELDDSASGKVIDWSQETSQLNKPYYKPNYNKNYNKNYPRRDFDKRGGKDKDVTVQGDRQVTSTTDLNEKPQGGDNNTSPENVEGKKKTVNRNRKRFVPDADDINATSDEKVGQLNEGAVENSNTELLSEKQLAEQFKDNALKHDNQGRNRGRAGYNRFRNNRNYSQNYNRVRNTSEASTEVIGDKTNEPDDKVDGSEESTQGYRNTKMERKPRAYQNPRKFNSRNSKGFTAVGGENEASLNTDEKKSERNIDKQSATSDEETQVSTTDLAPDGASNQMDPSGISEAKTKREGNTENRNPRYKGKDENYNPNYRKKNNYGRYRDYKKTEEKYFDSGQHVSKQLPLDKQNEVNLVLQTVSVSEEELHTKKGQPHDPCGSDNRADCSGPECSDSDLQGVQNRTRGQPRTNNRYMRNNNRFQKRYSNETEGSKEVDAEYDNRRPYRNSYRGSYRGYYKGNSRGNYTNYQRNHEYPRRLSNSAGSHSNENEHGDLTTDLPQNDQEEQSNIKDDGDNIRNDINKGESYTRESPGYQKKKYSTRNAQQESESSRKYRNKDHRSYPQDLGLDREEEMNHKVDDDTVRSQGNSDKPRNTGFRRESESSRRGRNRDYRNDFHTDNLDQEEQSNRNDDGTSMRNQNSRNYSDKPRLRGGYTPDYQRDKPSIRNADTESGSSKEIKSRDIHEPLTADNDSEGDITRNQDTGDNYVKPKYRNQTPYYQNERHSTRNSDSESSRKWKPRNFRNDSSTASPAQEVQSSHDDDGDNIKNQNTADNFDKPSYRRENSGYWRGKPSTRIAHQESESSRKQRNRDYRNDLPAANVDQEEQTTYNDDEDTVKNTETGDNSDRSRYRSDNSSYRREKPSARNAYHESESSRKWRNRGYRHNSQSDYPNKEEQSNHHDDEHATRYEDTREDCDDPKFKGVIPDYQGEKTSCHADQESDTSRKQRNRDYRNDLPARNPDQDEQSKYNEDEDTLRSQNTTDNCDNPRNPDSHQGYQRGKPSRNMYRDSESPRKYRNRDYRNDSQSANSEDVSSEPRAEVRNHRNTQQLHNQTERNRFQRYRPHHSYSQEASPYSGKKKLGEAKSKEENYVSNENIIPFTQRPMKENEVAMGIPPPFSKSRPLLPEP